MQRVAGKIFVSTPDLRLMPETAHSDIVDPLWKRVLNNRFTILEPIGRGGMGTVYKAIQSSLDRVVALKVLNSTPHLDPGFRQRFFLEASLTSKLRHPNTVTIIDYGETPDGIFYLAMEYLDGQPLSQVLAESKLLHWTRCLNIGQQICRSLRGAHKLGVVHRDLKPSNVMLLTEDGEQDVVKVLDFGLVKSFMLENDRQGQITNPGIFVGSPTYMAPEQLRGQADPRSDVYSLGALLYHLLVGKPPFAARDAIDVMYQHVHTPPVPLSLVRPELKLGEKVESLVMKCLEKQTSRRFQSMDEVLAALRSAAMDGKSVEEQVPATSSQSGPLAPAEATLAIDIELSPPPSIKTRLTSLFQNARRHRFLLPAVLVLAASVALSAIFIFRDGKRETTVTALHDSGATRGANLIRTPTPRPQEPSPVAKTTDSLRAEVVVNQVLSTPAETNIVRPERARNEGPRPAQAQKNARIKLSPGNRTAEPERALGELQAESSTRTEVAMLEATPSNPPSVAKEDGNEAASAPAIQPAAIATAQGSQPAPKDRIQLDDRKVQLTKLSGPDPEYSQKALDAEVEGVMLVKCTVTTEGAVQSCRVSKGLPHMGQAVLSALEHRTYKPYLLNGKPTEIDYTFRITLTLPR
jgi:serine/threonine-protein kinase